MGKVRQRPWAVMRENMLVFLVYLVELEGENASAGCSKRSSSKAAASEEARRTLRYVEPLSEARTMLADFFSILLDLLHVE